MSKLTVEQVRANRQELLDMWVNKINPEWVNLNHYLNNEDMEKVRESWSKDSIDYDEYDKAYHQTLENIAEWCEGPEGPKNTCGVVGCLAGWGRFTYRYRLLRWSRGL